jgi:hypothetical protein
LWLVERETVVAKRASQGSFFKVERQTAAIQSCIGEPFAGGSGARKFHRMPDIGARNGFYGVPGGLARVRIIGTDQPCRPCS